MDRSPAFPSPTGHTARRASLPLLCDGGLAMGLLYFAPWLVALAALGLALAGLRSMRNTGTAAEGGGMTRGQALVPSLMALGCALFLAVIIFPVFAKTKCGGPQSKSLNNIRQLAIGVQAYREDYGGAFPGWTKGAQGRMVHNVWDAQIDPYVKSKDVYDSGQGRGIRSPSQHAPQNRVLTYGLNGLLVTRPKRAFDGNGDWRHLSACPGWTGLPNPASTILFAELATQEPMGGPYDHAGGEPPVEDAASRYKDALAQWIDVDPRAWVETNGPNASSYYMDANPDTKRGVERALYGGGGSYAFADGHVKFMKLPDTVGIGKNGITVETAWSAKNEGNMWNPWQVR